MTRWKLDTVVLANKRLRTELNVTVSDDTARRGLGDVRLAAAVKESKPNLSKEKVADSLAFAKCKRTRLLLTGRVLSDHMRRKLTVSTLRVFMVLGTRLQAPRTAQS